MWINSDFDKTRWVERNLSAYYVAKHGNDRNDGHPRRPVASVARGIQLAQAAGQRVGWFTTSLSPVVIGSGVYSESVQTAEILLIGDGFVTFDGGGAVGFIIQGGNCGFSRLTIQNYHALNTAQNLQSYWRDTVVRSINYIDTVNYGSELFTMLNCLLDNAPRLRAQSTTNIPLLSLTNCTLMNAQLDSGGSNSIFVRNSYVDTQSRVGHANIPTVGLNNSNVQGYVKGMTLADFQLGTSNSAIDCVSVEPGFNNPASLDYTLAPTSQMRNLAFDGGFAGAYGIGINFAGLADAQSISNARYDATAGAFVLDDPAQKGVVDFNVKDFQRNWILKEALLVGEEDNVDFQTIDATISYDLDGFGMPADVQSGGLEAGRTYWNNGYDAVRYAGQDYANGQYFPVISDLTYTTIGAGKVVKLNEAPNIRLYEMKFSTISPVDCVSRPWQYFVFNKIPTVDAAGRSNGDVLFNPLTANPITVRYMKLRLTLMPNSLA